MSETIRLFVGCAPNGEDAESQAVLEYSLRKRASVPVDITWMKIGGQLGNWRTELWSTPFSGFRWAVPQLAGWQGKAIYCDSDVIFRADIAELYNQEFEPGKVIIAKGGMEGWRFCVSLFDCAALRKFIPPIPFMAKDPQSHRRMMAFFKSAILVQPFKGNWNCIDGEAYKDLNDPEIKLIHYSDESMQPHLIYARERLRRDGRKHWFDGKMQTHVRSDLRQLFDQELTLACSFGYDPRRYDVSSIDRVAYKIASHRGYRGNIHTQAKAI